MDIDLTYKREGNYLVPNLDLGGESPPLGKYGLMRQAYLREHRPVLWTRLCVSGRLFSHLSETEEAANALLERTLPALAESAGATEELKARDPIRWAGLMNACKAQAEEIIFRELIYC